MQLGHDQCYRIVCSRDRRFDGWFVTAVRTTGIYCRPSCPAITPKPRNVDFYPSAAAAQSGGFRACKRCRPDLSPRAPEWDYRSDVAARAVRLIADGVVERSGVAGLASELGYSERQLNRLLRAELGAGPIALARSQRAHTARVLLETTDVPVSDAAFAAGFGSIRQFNDTVRAVFDATPSQLRRASRLRSSSPTTQSSDGASIRLRLPVRQPFAHSELLAFLERRVITRVESVADGIYERSLRLPGGGAVAEVEFFESHLDVRLRLASLSDLQAAIARLRRLFDADADPVAIDEVLSGSPFLSGAVAACPGLRSPGTVDPCELAVRAIVGQQISVVAAGGVLARIAERYGSPLSVIPRDGGSPDRRAFPTAEQVAAIDPSELPMPMTRARAIVDVASGMVTGRLALGPGSDRDAAYRDLLDVKGIGPWTASYIAMRGLGDPDIILPRDVGVDAGFERLGGSRERLEEEARRWSPWRSYATHHLWRAASSAGERTT